MSIVTTRNSQPLKYQGFTLIELILVIVLLSILTISAVSRFNGQSGFSEYTYQARLVTLLRHLQTHAMFDTRPDFCSRLNLDLDIPAFGPPRLNSSNPGDTCSGIIDYDNPDYLTTTQTEMSDDGILLNTQGDNDTRFTYIQFDNMGRPSTSASNCDNTCVITITGEAEVKVCIESQGYIHACE